jgi:hypothetical protein
MAAQNDGPMLPNTEHMKNEEDYTIHSDDFATWNAKVQKYEWGLTDPSSASKELLRDYALTKIWYYKNNHTNDYSLWDLFRSDFEGWSEDQFKALPQTVRTNLRAVLRCGGVVVHAHSKTSIPRVLMEVLEQDQPAPWTEDEHAVAAVDLQRGPMNSKRIAASWEDSPINLDYVSPSQKGSVRDGPSSRAIEFAKNQQDL